MQLGVIGLGRMSAGMVRRLVRSGHPHPVGGLEPSREIFAHQMETFGACAPLKEPQRRLGFEPERVVAVARQVVERS